MIVTDCVIRTPDAFHVKRRRISDEELIERVEFIKANTMEKLAEELGYSRQGLTKRVATARRRLAAKKKSEAS